MQLDMLKGRLKDLEQSKLNLEIEYQRVIGRMFEIQFLLQQVEIQNLVDTGEPDNGDNI